MVVNEGFGLGATSGTDLVGSTAGAGAGLGVAMLAGALILLAGLTGLTLSLVESAATALIEIPKKAIATTIITIMFRYISLPPGQVHQSTIKRPSKKSNDKSPRCGVI